VAGKRWRGGGMERWKVYNIARCTRDPVLRQTHRNTFQLSSKLDRSLKQFRIPKTFINSTTAQENWVTAVSTMGSHLILK